MDLSSTSHLDDEALSATLDAPEDSEEAMPTHLAGCAECAQRRRQLAAARAALATAPVEPLDELTRRRLLSRAVAQSTGEAPSRQRLRHPALAGGIAAAIFAVLVAVPFLGREPRRGEQQQLSATAGSAQVAAVFLGDLGEVSGPQDIRIRLGATTTAESGARERAPAPVAPAAPAPSPLARSSGADAGRAPEPAPPSVGPAEAAVADECASTLAAGPARGTRLVATGLATLRGKPVVLSVFATPAGEVAYLTERDGCRLLQRYSLW